MQEEGKRKHPEEIFQRTPGLAALFHEIRYSANNHGIAPENLTNYAYLRVFEHMGEELSSYEEARRKHIAFDSERREKLREFGINGFYIVMEVAREVSGITSDALLPFSREDSRGGIYRYTSLAPFIGVLEGDPQKPTTENMEALKVYLGVLKNTLPQYRLFRSSSKQR